MSDIDSQIMEIMRRPEVSRISCYEMADKIRDAFGDEYPCKRVRNRLDSLCNYGFLVYEKEIRGKGMRTKVYSLVEAVE